MPASLNLRFRIMVTALVLGISAYVLAAKAFSAESNVCFKQDLKPELTLAESVNRLRCVVDELNKTIGRLGEYGDSQPNQAPKLPDASRWSI